MNITCVRLHKHLKSVLLGLGLSAPSCKSVTKKVIIIDNTDP